MYSKRKRGPKASWTTIDLDSLAARLRKQNQPGVNGLFLDGKYPHRAASQGPRQNKHEKTWDLKKHIKINPPEVKPKHSAIPKD